MYKSLIRNYFFTGKHFHQVNDLVSDRKNSFFKSNIDLFILAALYGIVENTRSTKVNSAESTKIPDVQFENNYDEVWFVLQLAVICDPESKIPVDERLKKLYESPEIPSDYLTLLESYVLGGLELLHQRLIIRRGAPTEEKVAAMTQCLMDWNEASSDVTYKDIRDKISEIKTKV